MPQHSLNVPDGTGNEVRTGFNSALVALGSSMKGASAPPAPQAGMIWVDDNTPTTARWEVKMYDGADWIVLGILDTSTNLFEPASTATGLALIRAADAAAGRTAIAADVASQTGAGVGQVIAWNTTAGSGYSMPSGGTWEAFWFGTSASTGTLTNGMLHTIAAGGTTIQAGVGGVQFSGVSKRIA
jgi:hypothetical protein